MDIIYCILFCIGLLLISVPRDGAASDSGQISYGAESSYKDDASQSRRLRRPVGGPDRPRGAKL